MEKIAHVLQRRFVPVFALLFLLLAVPLTVLVSVQTKDYRSKAATTVSPYSMPILVLRYFPTKDHVHLDSTVTGYTSTLSDVRTKVTTIRDQTIAALEEGSRFHGYKDPNAVASLNFSVVDDKEFLAPIPISTTYPTYPDNFKIFSDSSIGVSNICDYVDNQGVKEVWVFMYQVDGVTVPNESDMAGPYGNISNSYRRPDLPVCSKTYTVYDYNYSRTTAEATHDHGHQLEAILSYVDSNIYNNDFIGPWKTYGSDDGSVTAHRCGWTHTPPNTSTEYDYTNTNFVYTDCENWTPSGSGQAVRINCQEWSCDETKFHIWQWQNMPGLNSGDPYLSNWWDFYGDFDKAMAAKEKLFYPKPADIDKDGVVALSDLSILLSNWGQAFPSADIDGSGVVDLGDLSNLLSNWGSY